MNNKPRSSSEREDDEERYRQSELQVARDHVAELEAQLRDRNSRIDQLANQLDTTEKQRDEWLRRKTKVHRARIKSLEDCLRRFQLSITKQLVKG